MEVFTNNQHQVMNLVTSKMESALQKNTENFTSIPITNRALDKIKAYARLAKSSEVYGFPIAPIDSVEGIIQDAFLAVNQTASGGSASITPVAAAESKAYLENLGYKALGFWHSHGNYSVFHSGIDDGNLDTLLGSFAGNNEERLSKPRKSCSYVDHEAGKIIYSNNLFEITLTLERGDTSYESRMLGAEFLKLTNGSANIVAALTDDFKLMIRDGSNVIIAQRPAHIEIRKPRSDEARIVGAAYSVVVNRKDDIFAKMAVSKWCSLCERDEVSITEDVKLRVIDSEKAKLDIEQLKKDLEERVKGSGWF